MRATAASVLPDRPGPVRGLDSPPAYFAPTVTTLYNWKIWPQDPIGRDKNMNQWVKGLALGVATGLAGVALGFAPPGQKLERNVGLPWLFGIRGEIPAPSDVVVVAIDQNTGPQLGLPALPREWSRSIYAQLVDRLTERNASVIVFDLELDKPKSVDGDLAFAEAIGKSGRIVLFERLSGQKKAITDSAGREVGSLWVEELIPPMPILVESASGVGPFPLPKIQIAVDQFWAFKPSAVGAPTLPAVALQLHARDIYEHWYEILREAATPGLQDVPNRYEDLSRASDVRNMMRAVRSAFGEDPGLAMRVVDAIENAGGPVSDPMTSQLLGALVGLYAGENHRYLNFYGPPGTITTIPFHAVIRDSDPYAGADALDLAGKVVFVGFSSLTDPGQPDRYFTVFTRNDGVDLSGVEIAATAFANLLTDRSLKPVASLTSVLIHFGFGLLLGAIVYLVPALVGVPLAFAIAGAYAFATQLGFNLADIGAPLAVPLLVQFPIALFGGLAGQYLLERRKEKQVSQLISTYVPESVLQGLTQHAFDPTALDTVVYGTCLATDMSRFTTISEQMKPNELATFVNSYFDRLAESLKRHKPTVTEFHADTIMCAWTAPGPERSGHHDAIFAGLDIVETIGRFTREETRFHLDARIGLESGQFYVGHTGGGGQMTYRVLGDCVNTAARLESLNKQLSTRVLATASVVDGADAVLWRPLGMFLLVGKTNPTQVVEIMARRTDAGRTHLDLCERFAEALDLFRAGRWSRAGVRFRAILKDYADDGPARFYLERCRQYLRKAPKQDDPSIVVLDVK